MCWKTPFPRRFDTSGSIAFLRMQQVPEPFIINSHDRHPRLGGRASFARALKGNSYEPVIIHYSVPQSEVPR